MYNTVTYHNTCAYKIEHLIRVLSVKNAIYKSFSLQKKFEFNLIVLLQLADAEVSLSLPPEQPSFVTLLQSNRESPVRIKGLVTRD